MSDPLATAQEIGKAAGKPLATFRQVAGNGVVVNAPFYFCTGKGKTKSFRIVVGANTAAVGTVSFTINRIRGGSSSALETFTLGAWTAGVVNEVSTGAHDVEDGDILSVDIANGAATALPALMIGVAIEFGA